MRECERRIMCGIVRRIAGTGRSNEYEWRAFRPSGGCSRAARHDARARRRQAAVGGECYANVKRARLAVP
jgi:hypothetical protein